MGRELIRWTRSRVECEAAIANVSWITALESRLAKTGAAIGLSEVIIAKSFQKLVDEHRLYFNNFEKHLLE
jgi:Na+/H+ antiporter NhaB